MGADVGPAPVGRRPEPRARAVGSRRTEPDGIRDQGFASPPAPGGAGKAPRPDEGICSAPKPERKQRLGSTEPSARLSRPRVTSRNVVSLIQAEPAWPDHDLANQPF